MADSEHKTIIGPLTAALLYAALIGASFAVLTGTPRTIALIVIFGLAAKSYIDYLRRRTS
jgi:Asp/Glu/hydantoin racemase